MYTASKALWDILCQNGFKNVSFQYKHLHPNFYDGNKPYDPGIHQLAFATVKGKSRFTLLFEYDVISVSYAGTTISEETNTLTESQLRSIIAFFKMPYNRRYKLIEETNDRIDTGFEQLLKHKNESATSIPLMNGLKLPA